MSKGQFVEFRETPEPKYRPRASPEQIYRNDTQLIVVFGYLLGAAAFLFFPIICGPVSIILGGVALSRESKHGVAVIVLGAVGTVVGIYLGMFVFLTMW